MNPRYTSFIATYGWHPNYVFMEFIQTMLKMFAESKGGNHTPLNPFTLSQQGHNDFTAFIRKNADRFELI